MINAISPYLFKKQRAQESDAKQIVNFNWDPLNSLFDESTLTRLVKLTASLPLKINGWSRCTISF